ncbi:urea transporter [Mollisia scopiformis]|uniref:Urea transporter n=1 Tax=Mollisia scopiformis TaxID=149040 RepID=A0A194X9K5_MOLSC|nr:urea transporter [Mollisia scopiformis]KUJ16851.1 urea transporter [Mollisia scopiformis]
MAVANLELLSPGEGYGIVIGLGIGFTLIMIVLSLIQNRYGKHNTFKSAEEFNAASRSVKPGMIAAGILSSWTHASTLLTSCTLSYSYGVGGELWYGAVGTFQTLFFAVAAFKIKEKSNNAHTFPEIVLQKHGAIAHCVFTFFGLVTNLINSSALMAGGSAVFYSLTGMNIWAAYWILPAIVTAYIVVGGLRATFSPCICDYLHTIFLYVCIFAFMFQTYSINPNIGSPAELWKLLKDKEVSSPADSYNGKSATLSQCINGLVTAATIFLSGFSAVWTDQAYWQRAIASQPATAVKGYVLGSFAWYAIPFAMSSTLGLVAAALTGTSVLPIKLSAAQVSAGLVGLAAAIALMNKVGAGLMVVLVFMATTSSTSAESIAASSLITFDIYKAYINPKATTRSMFWVSVFGLAIYGAFLAAISCIFHSVGISLNWLIKILGCLLGGGTIPMACVLLWDRTSTFAVIVSPIIGLVCGLTSWMVATQLRSGVINITTTSNVWSSLTGDCVSLGMGGVRVILFTFLVPNKKKLAIIEATPELESTGGARAEKTDLPVDSEASPDHKIGRVVEENVAAQDLKPIEGEEYVPEEALTLDEVKSQKRMAWLSLIIGTLIFMIVIPFSLYGIGYDFSEHFFTGFIVIAFLWIWASFVICVFMPVWESRKDMWYIAGAMYRDVTRSKVHYAE